MIRTIKAKKWMMTPGHARDFREVGEEAAKAPLPRTTSGMNKPKMGQCLMAERASIWKKKARARKRCTKWLPGEEERRNRDHSGSGQGQISIQNRHPTGKRLHFVDIGANRFQSLLVKREIKPGRAVRINQTGQHDEQQGACPRPDGRPGKAFEANPVGERSFPPRKAPPWRGQE